ncbi:MAG: cation:proton antiporter [Desulfatibacillaceae bacterium]
MNRGQRATRFSFLHLLAALLLAGSAVVALGREAETPFQVAGRITLSLGFLMLFAHAAAHVLVLFRLPRITGYIFAGILVGPHAAKLLTASMVRDLALIDDLALSFIALAAGGSLRLASLRKRSIAIGANVGIQSILIFGAVFAFVVYGAGLFAYTASFSRPQVLAVAVLLGVTAIARSPSSAIAVISECRARGVFTETLLGVTVAIDVVIILLFTLAISVSRALVFAGQGLNASVFAGVGLEIAASIVVGATLGRVVILYIERVGKDLVLFLACFAFGTTKCAHWLADYTHTRFGMGMELEPLLICMTAGFVVMNASRHGERFVETLEAFSLPIYVLFFSLAGARLDLGALAITWPLALTLVVVRGMGIAAGSWVSGLIARDPPIRRNHAWMGYMAQAGVAIGLAQLASRQFPEIGDILATIVLAVITINQIVGPVLLKVALSRVGDAGRKRGDEG